MALDLECATLPVSRMTKDLNPYVEARREWNDRYLIEWVFGWMSDTCDAKQLYHRVDEYLEM